ncbi:hypothetical protein [Aquihabitans sp. McL0605]|uniref:hypothetical protein n=1 Tax=Aquihabitans sp. McL0605 TaxID=3415671 RepID=UPI003CF29BEC
MLLCTLFGLVTVLAGCGAGQNSHAANPSPTVASSAEPTSTSHTTSAVESRSTTTILTTGVRQERLQEMNEEIKRACLQGVSDFDSDPALVWDDRWSAVGTEAEARTAINKCMGDMRNVQAEDDQREYQKEQDSKMTMAEFTEIQTGMTYSQVKGIVGSGGELVTSTELGGTKTEGYSWDGVAEFSTGSVIFQNGIAISKTQVGLT